MAELSIVIVSWNAKAALCQCLASIRDNPPPFPWQTIVVDNASADGSPACVGEEFPGVRLVANNANRGFAVANNQGAREADAAWLLFLNPDTRVHPGTLAGAVSFMEQHPEAGVMGCRTLNPDGSLQASAFAFPGQLRIFAYVLGLNRFFKLSRFTDHSCLSTPDYVQGSFLLIGRELFAGLGGFDERFFLYSEEVDLCLRAQQAGRRVYYHPGVTITHSGGGSTGNSLEALGHFIESQVILYRKFRPRQVGRLRRILNWALRLRLAGEWLSAPRRFGKKKTALARVRESLRLTAGGKENERER